MAKAVVERFKRGLPERLAQTRGGRSQQQFARDLGVGRQNVNRYESGTTPHVDFLITLVAELVATLRRAITQNGETHSIRLAQQVRRPCPLGGPGRLRSARARDLVAVDGERASHALLSAGAREA